MFGEFERCDIGDRDESVGRWSLERPEELFGFGDGVSLPIEPTHKLWLAANYLPTITGTDHGTWRRLRVIPFDVRIGDTDRDPKLPEALRQEMPGILRWIVEGAIAWQEDGLETPPQVSSATHDWQIVVDRG